MTRPPSRRWSSSTTYQPPGEALENARTRRLAPVAGRSLTAVGISIADWRGCSAIRKPQDHKLEHSSRGAPADPSSDIHAVTVDIFAVDDDVPDIDADPELDSIVFGAAYIALANLPLDLDSVSHGVYGGSRTPPPRRRP